LDPVMRDEILDVFLDFIQDEQNSVLLSSHITSDLEKVADYIVFIHQGKVIFSLPKDTLLYQYGILRCRTEEFNQIDKGDILAYQKKDFEWERSEEHTSELQSRFDLVCRLLLVNKNSRTLHRMTLSS